MNLNESLTKIDGLDSMSLVKSGVYKDTHRCIYKGENAFRNAFSPLYMQRCVSL